MAAEKRWQPQTMPGTDAKRAHMVKKAPNGGEILSRFKVQGSRNNSNNGLEVLTTIPLTQRILDAQTDRHN